MSRAGAESPVGASPLIAGAPSHAIKAQEHANIVVKLRSIAAFVAANFMRQRIR